KWIAIAICAHHFAKQSAARIEMIKTSTHQLFDDGFAIFATDRKDVIPLQRRLKRRMAKDAVKLHSFDGRIHVSMQRLHVGHAVQQAIESHIFDSSFDDIRSDYAISKSACEKRSNS